MGERLFTPWSLARVAEAVEWEDYLTEKVDGTTNQQQYMKALAILWERWMRGWEIPDFLSAVENVGNQRFAEQFTKIIDSVEQRITQVLGFWQGIWAGANPGWKAARGFLGMSEYVPLTPDEVVRLRIETFKETLKVLLKQY